MQFLNVILTVFDRVSDLFPASVRELNNLTSSPTGEGAV